VCGQAAGEAIKLQDEVTTLRRDMRTTNDECTPGADVLCCAGCADTGDHEQVRACWRHTRRKACSAKSCRTTSKR
jgi:hypothetical protein